MSLDLSPLGLILQKTNTTMDLNEWVFIKDFCRSINNKPPFLPTSFIFSYKFLLKIKGRDQVP
jgi:hypothetical protein